MQHHKRISSTIRMNDKIIQLLPIQAFQKKFKDLTAVELKD